MKGSRIAKMMILQRRRQAPNVLPANKAFDARSTSTPQTFRKRFVPDEDYILAVQVNKDTPFMAEHGSI